MGTAVLNLVGLVLSLGMTASDFNPDKDIHKTTIRVGVGLASNPDDNTKGDTPGIHLWDIMGRSFKDISIPFDAGVGNEPSEYIAIVNGGIDVLCISYLAVTEPDGTKKVWYGDVGMKCGADWYQSMSRTGSDDYQPHCIWIDRDGSNGLRFQGFGLHINDFDGTKERAAQYGNDTDLMCKADPRFKMYEQMDSSTLIPTFQPPLDYTEGTLTDPDPAAVMDPTRWVLPSSPPPNPVEVDTPAPIKRVRRADNPAPPSSSTHPRSSVSSSPAAKPTSALQRLIVSSSKHHSAQLLCDSASSRGPDFISLQESLFCDMEHKKAYPLCEPQHSSGCFDQQTNTIRVVVVRGRDATTGVPPSAAQKSYGKVEYWD